MRGTVPPVASSWAGYTLGANLVPLSEWASRDS